MDNLKRDKSAFKQENDYLLRHKKNVTSQCGEDGIIEKIFEIIGENDKYCIEFGAGDGKENSNTWNLITNKGWSGIEIEVKPELYKKLLQTYKNNGKVICINKQVNFEGSDILDNILLKTPIPKSFDLLSIDIDGNDYHVWESGELYKPRVVLIEFNPTIPADIEFVQPRDIEVNQGSSLLSLVNLGKKKGYELIAALDCNAFFVKKEYFELFAIQDNSPQLIRKEHKYETRLFQLYDGTLVLADYKKLLWHNVAIDQAKIQVLPKFLRKYPAKIKPSFLLKVWSLFYREKSFSGVFLKILLHYANKFLSRKIY